MKNLFFVLLFLFTAALHAQTPGEMNQMAGLDFDKSDRKLVAVYRKLISTLDATSKQKLVASEKAWLAFRETQAKFEADYNARGGKMAFLFYNTSRAETTDARIKQLKDLLYIKPGY